MGKRSTQMEQDVDVRERTDEIWIHSCHTNYAWSNYQRQEIKKAKCLCLTRPLNYTYSCVQPNRKQCTIVQYIENAYCPYLVCVSTYAFETKPTNKDSTAIYYGVCSSCQKRSLLLTSES